MDIPRIPEFYAGKRIFITGATGFMGKVLVEKLLRSCPDVDRLYVLIRCKKGMSAAERWAELSNLPCFERLHKEQPGAFLNKVTVLDGDVRNERLGLSEENYDLLVKTTDVIFHVAASVRFNDPLPEAIRMNTFGTKSVVDAAVQMTNLQVFVHVSTTYCYCNKCSVVEEKVYPVDMDWRTVLDINQNIDPVSFDILGQKFTDFAPNTYVFSKALAEQIIDDYKDRIPVVIVRPSIVISSWKEPMPGWVDNFNGPIGLIVAGGKGVIRIALSDPEAIPDYMAVDVSIKAMIIAAWKACVPRGAKKLGNVEVYNSSSTSAKSISNRELLEMSRDIQTEMPLHETLWTPSYAITRSFAMYRIRSFFAHFLVALLVDTLLRLIGKSPMLLKIQIKVQNAMVALGYFTTKEWTFKNDRFRALNDAVLPSDREDFDFSFDTLEPIDYFRIATAGVKKYLLHEDPDYQPQAKRKAEWLVILDKVVRYLISFGLFYWLSRRYVSA
ncbi:Male sterility protein [Nesidiocoris tenuis]|uniref:Fatty acyl-CoA reductase n=1 Tax=Nesidiocoris tenuis TaxID=355587 RepID=A0ABN7AQ24_9HEMI|nr:Male sterility protein [Nesidiocoris tenuis]